MSELKIYLVDECQEDETILRHEFVRYSDYKVLEKELADCKKWSMNNEAHQQLQKLKEMYLEVYPALDFTKVLAEKQDDSFYEKHRKFKDELLKQSK